MKTKTAHYSYQNSLVQIYISTNFGSTFSFQKSPPDVFYQKGVLKNFTKFFVEHLRQLFLPFISVLSFLSVLNAGKS